MEDFWEKRLYNFIQIASLFFWANLSHAQMSDSSFIHIYNTILSHSCGIPACHDGSFEPNFSSIASSYNTLVFHPVVKNNVANNFVYRVVPYSTQNSVLFERITNCCFVNVNDRMPFTLSDTLPSKSIEEIRNWIDKGAKSPEGLVYKKKIHPPLISNECHLFGNDSIDLYENKWRQDKLFYGSSLIPTSISSITFRFRILPSADNSGADSLLVVCELSDNDFQSPVTQSFPTIKDGNDWLCRIDKKEIPSKIPVYYRVKVIYQETQKIYFPNQSMEKFYRLNWSLIIEE